LNKDEKKAFWKFFLTYFISVALLILVAGYFYFAQMKQQLTKFEHFSMIKYAKRLKGSESIEGFYGYSHTYIDKKIDDFSIDNFIQKKEHFEKWVPANTKDRYIFITKTSTAYEERVEFLFYKLLGLQSFLLGIFALLSFFLARNALSPLRKNIEKLDRFAKDLIHDLNTPVTSIGLNIKVLSKVEGLHNHKALKRLQKSANDISDLHTNLSFLLKEHKYELEEIDLKEMIDVLVQEYSILYPNLRISSLSVESCVNANTLALKQILDNLLSNACKYSYEKGKVSFSFEGNTLALIDDGIGIKNPERVFERNYTENNHSSGIGMDIVKRLCDMMHIPIKVKSLEKGTSILLVFK